MITEFSEEHEVALSKVLEAVILAAASPRSADESMMTGEPIPVEKVAGTTVIGGTLVAANDDALGSTAAGTASASTGGAGAAGSREQVGVMQATGFKGIGQRPEDMLLPYRFRKVLGSPLAGEYQVAHRFID